MEFKAKVKYLLEVKGFSISDYAKKISLTRQGTNKRISNGKINMKEMSELCEMTGHQLAVLDENGKVIFTFHQSDWEQ